jgi:hypothetical protein
MQVVFGLAGRYEAPPDRLEIAQCLDETPVAGSSESGFNP